jgi:hypothetical protein
MESKKGFKMQPFDRHIEYTGKEISSGKKSPDQYQLQQQELENQARWLMEPYEADIKGWITEGKKLLSTLPQEKRQNLETHLFPNTFKPGQMCLR